MERLTVRRKDGRAAIANKDGASPLEQTMKIPVALDRLAAYEDTGLEPEDINVMVECANEDDLGISYTRLRELAEADKDGRCMVLPCKVGDTIYLVCKPCEKPLGIYPVEVGGFAIDDDKKIMVCPGWSIDCVREFANAEDFGKTAFLTPEAAEAALEAHHV